MGQRTDLTAELSGVGQGTELSTPNSQRHAIKQQRLRAGAG
jgi:hypothetical protein